MKLFAGKTSTEKKKIVAAMVLGVMSLTALWMAFGGSIVSRRPSVTVSQSPTPKPSASPVSGSGGDQIVSDETAQDLAYLTVPVVYNGGIFSAPDAGRNIFAFYEPPPPTPYSPTPFVVKPETPVPPPPPTPTPPVLIGFIQPQNVFAGAKGFRLEINGDKFTPDAQIIFNGTALPTTFVSPQKLVADVPAGLISGEGGRQIIVQTPDGKLYSNSVILTVQPQPRPAFQYIGMIARKRYNNDTAYFQEQGKTNPIGARLNDVVGGRFRLVSISASETVFEDVNLGFRHRVPLYRPAPGQATSGAPGRSSPDGFSPPGGYNPYQNNVPQSIPGIPDTIPRYVPPPQTQQPDKDVDDDGDN